MATSSIPAAADKPMVDRVNRYGHSAVTGDGSGGEGEMPTSIRVAIDAAGDIVPARDQGRRLAEAHGLSMAEATLVATAISELARNIVTYAGSGEVLLEIRKVDGRPGLTVTARDQGPGIGDPERALSGGYSTSGGLGLGISGVRRIMDDLDIDTGPDKGTTVVATKWL